MVRLRPCHHGYVSRPACPVHRFDLRLIVSGCFGWICCGRATPSWPARMPPLVRCCRLARRTIAVHPAARASAAALWCMPSASVAMRMTSVVLSCHSRRALIGVRPCPPSEPHAFIFAGYGGNRAAALAHPFRRQADPPLGRMPSGVRVLPDGLVSDRGAHSALDSPRHRRMLSRQADMDRPGNAYPPGW